MYLLYCLIFLCFLPIFYKLYKTIANHKRYRDIINKIPGPEAVWVFGNVLQFKLNRIEFTIQGNGFLYRYGYSGIYRMWVGHVPTVILSRSDTAEPLLSSNKLIEKASNYNFLKTWIGTGLLTSGGEKWRSRRKMLTHAFHFSILNSFIPIYHKQALILVDQVKHFANNGLSFNLYPFISRCALDIICETAMGSSINAQINHKSEYVLAVLKMCEILYKYERMPWLWIKPIFRFSSIGQTYDKTLNVLRTFVQKVVEVIDERVEERKQFQDGSKFKKSHSAFLDLLLDMQNEHRLSYSDIQEEVDTFMFEGHDTTSSSMVWTMFLLGHHKSIHDKVYEEIESIFGSDTRVPTDEDVKRLKYLEQVIKEALRLYPAVPMFARRTTDELKIGVYDIPVDTTVLIVPMLIHREKKIWGENVNNFDPDRFSPENSSGRPPFAFVPFSAGSRNCIGQKFAIMEEKIVLSTILRNYEVKSLFPIEQTLAIPELVLRPANGLPVRLIPRK